VESAPKTGGVCEEMMAVNPGVPSYAESMARIAEILETERVKLADIKKMSEESMRDWLQSFVIRISERLGLALGQVAAMIADLVQIGKNAGSAFSTSFSENYKQHRRILPYGEE
jgi:hypothetical protein